jgi:hypothetical protein
MDIYTIDPMLDSRWDNLVAFHPRASVFHHKGWLKALAKTYGYRPVVLTSAPPGTELSNGIVFCEVRSWITGNRLISMPFADHCDPLRKESEDLFDLNEWLRAECDAHKWQYIELRPRSPEIHPDCSLVPSRSFWLHTLDLTSSIEQMFCNLHKNCIQRRIRHAERESLYYERGCSEELLNGFYRLLLITRRRHHLLPQPLAWFKNLVAFMSPNAEIRLASKGGIPIAAIMTLGCGRTVVYKYGCSDERFHQCGAMPFLFWKLIEESKTVGAEEIDFGRTELDNDGLVEFKDRLGTRRSRITYLRFPENARVKDVVASYQPALGGLFSVLPDAVSSRAGRLVYRHIG